MAEPFLGEIKMFGGNFAPRGWAFCDGQLLPISQNQALFSILGTMYGGDGSTTFALPDLRGRFAMHPGNGPGLTPRPQGQKAGQETVTLNANQIPSHTHPLSGVALPTTNAVGNETVPDGHIPAVANDGESNYSSAPPTGSMALSGNTTPAGGGQAHDNIPPFTTVQFIIALQGIFPSRN